MPDKSLLKTATRIRAARKSKGLTQAQVAVKVGISMNYYSMIERGEKDPGTSITIKIIDALGVTAADILGK